MVIARADLVLRSPALDVERIRDPVRLAFVEPAESREHVERVAIVVLILDLQVHVDVGPRAQEPSSPTGQAGIALRRALLVVVATAAAPTAIVRLTAEVVLNANVETVGRRPGRRRNVKVPRGAV